ncbi:MAG: RHS repeat-associated core domain-containing protein, partial [Acidobacteriota bacterium]|nr:RHS repeat-associated core domain-containing protein [Acidobacteriota bacterium]
ALSLRRGGGGGGCLKQATMFLYALRTGFGDDGSSSQEIGTSSDGSDCPLGTLFNAYYQPAGSNTVVLLYAQPQGIPRIQLPDQPAGAGHGQYWFTAVDPATMQEFDQSPVIIDDARNTTRNQNPASAPASRNLQYVHRDHLGSTRLMTDENGVEIGRWKYFPFGMEATVEESGDQRMKFTGHERDGEVELDYMLMRSCSYGAGRFLSPDPSMESVLFRIPATWNRYSYVRSNPIARVDPDGMKDRRDDQDKAILEDPEVKAAVREAWVESNPDGNSGDDMQEVGFVVTQPVPGDYRATDLVTDGKPTSVALPEPDSDGNLEGEPVAATVHTHPAEGEFVTNTGTGNSERGREGMSRADTRNVDETGVAGYVVGRRALYRYRPGDRRPKRVLTGKDLRKYLGKTK